MPMLPPRRAVKYTASTHIVWDGNSLFQTGIPLTPNRVMALAPLAGSGVTWANVAIAGQTWQNMTATATDVDGAFSSTRQNVLVLWEHTNAICNAGRTVEQCYTDMVAYITARRLVVPDLRILVLQTLPRQEFTPSIAYSTVMQINVALQQIDKLVQDNRHALDIAVCPMRGPGSPFALTGYAEEDFAAIGSLYSETTPGMRVHLGPAGQDVAQKYILAALQRLTY